jgi:hypothetical protein
MKSLEQYRKDLEISDSQKKLQDIMKSYEFPQPDGPEKNLTKGKTYEFPVQPSSKPVPYKATTQKATDKSKPFGELGTPGVDYEMKYGKLPKSEEVSKLKDTFEKFKKSSSKKNGSK